MPNLSSIKTEILCQYCKKKYMAYKKGRTHCRKDACRSKEIINQLDGLAYFIGLLCINKIEATIELRFPGNDKLSKEAKVDSTSSLNGGLKVAKTDQPPGMGVEELIVYFRHILWKEVKGNFIVKTKRDGTIDPTILNQTFIEISDPLIIGNNLIVGGSAKNLRKGGNVV